MKNNLAVLLAAIADWLLGWIGPAYEIDDGHERAERREREWYGV